MNTQANTQMNTQNKAQTNITQMLFILDRSGSMSGLESDTIGGFNSMIEKQKESEGKALVTTVLFSDKVQYLHDREDIRLVNHMTKEEYFASGCTALLDAVGYSIRRIVEQNESRPDWERPDHTVVVITTDGLENASQSFSYEDIRRLISSREEMGWEFLFLGANIDAAEAASSIGISRERASNFINDSRGIQTNFEAISDAMMSVRSCGRVDDRWDESIKKDMRSR